MTTTTGIVLVDSLKRYRSWDGDLPPRPTYDKELLLSLIDCRIVLASPNTIDALPTSLKLRALAIQSDPLLPHDINLGISTFGDAPPAKMIVVHSHHTMDSGGPKFRFPGRYVMSSAIPMMDSTLAVYTRSE